MAAPSTDIFKLGFIGAGNMAESIARGVAKSGVLPPTSICTAHRRPERRLVFESFGVRILETNSQVGEAYQKLEKVKWSIQLNNKWKRACVNR